MTDQITTPVGGSDSGPVMVGKLLDIHDWWYGADARDEETTIAGSVGRLSDLLSGTSFVALECGETRLTYAPKLNFLNDPDDVILTTLFGASEEGVWFDPDPTTWFTDEAGAIPAQVGQAVALMLDKSRGLALGPELRGTGTLNGTGELPVEPSYNPSTGEGTIGRVDAANRYGVQISGLVSGRTYLIDVENLPSSDANINIRSPGVGSTFIPGFASIEPGNRLAQRLAVPVGETAITFAPAPELSEIYLIIHSVRELPGNHATQPTAAARPILARVPASGRRNVLVESDSLSTQTRPVSAVEHTLSFKGEGTVTLTGASTAGPLEGTGAEDIVSLTFTPTAGDLTLTVSGTVELAQLEVGDTRTTYQTVADAGGFDVTEAGQPDNWYLFDDLVDDAINWTAPEGDYTVAFIDTGGEVTILEEQALDGETNVLQSQRTGSYLAVDRALTQPEKDRLTAYLLRKGSGL